MVTATGHSKKVSGHSLVMANKGLQVVDIQLLVIVVIVVIVYLPEFWVYLIDEQGDK